MTIKHRNCAGQTLFKHASISGQSLVWFWTWKGSSSTRRFTPENWAILLGTKNMATMFSSSSLFTRPCVTNTNVLWIKMTIAREILGFNHQISYYKKTWRLTATTSIAGSYITKWNHTIYTQHNELYCCAIRHATLAVFKCPVSSLLHNVIYTTFTLFFKDQVLLQDDELVASDEQVQGPHSV